MKTIILSGFFVVAIVQWFVPLSMIWKSESTISEGQEYRFKTAPVDPSDPFRGKYITLRYEEDHLTTDTLYAFTRGQEVYVELIVDEKGFAVVNRISAEPPSDESAVVVKAEVNSAYNDGNGGQLVYFSYPFQIFYMEESKASEAEQLYWENRRDSSQNVYAVVKLKDGNAVLTDVRINDKSIVDIVREINASEP